MKTTLYILMYLLPLFFFFSLWNYQEKKDKTDVEVYVCRQNNNITYYSLQKPTAKAYDMNVIGDCKKKEMKYLVFRQTRYVIFPKRSRR